jgi:hypothetical protein
MAHAAIREHAAEQYLRNLDALAEIAGFGPVSTVLLEFDTAPVAVARATDGIGCLIKGSSPAAASRVRLIARRLSGQPRASADELDDESGGLEVAKVSLEPAGQAVTAKVELMHEGRRVVATSTGRNAVKRHLYLMAEAAARAVTEFLPPGYGVILGGIQSVPQELGDTLRAAVLFMTPTEDKPLEGVAAVEDRPDIAAARTVLAAVGEYVKPLLSRAGTSP